MILQTLISIIQTVWQISTNQMYDEEPQQLKENFVMFTKAFRQIGFISGSLLIILTKPLMMIIARNDFYEGWVYVPFLVLSIVFSFSTGMVSSLYGAYEKNSGALYSVLVGGIVNIILNAFLIPKIGVLGATISTAVSRLVIAIYRLKDTERLLQFDREYGVIGINCVLIIAQCCMLIFMKKTVYPLQIVFLAVICVYNREIFTKGFRYITDILRRK
jgi:O-antigen/teichoic acid export membrane protein